jgi:hypothetical protein
MYLKRYFRISTLVVIAFCYPSFSYSAEGFMCQAWYEDVARANSNLKAQGKNLSKLAKDAIFSKSKTAIQECMRECENEKFKFCNDFANYLENN